MLGLDHCSMHHSTIHKENPTRCNSVSKFIIPCLHEAEHVLGDTPPITRSLKMHQQPLVFHTWKVVGLVGGGHVRNSMCLTCPPEAVGAVLGS
jgi:hypothetical protein